jgi:YesN/AraC family two-component response regulator
MAAGVIRDLVFHVLPNYLGDVVKKTTGETAGRYIRRFLVQWVKNELMSGKTV